MSLPIVHLMQHSIKANFESHLVILNQWHHHLSNMQLGARKGEIQFIAEIIHIFESINKNCSRQEKK